MPEKCFAWEICSPSIMLLIVLLLSLSFSQKVRITLSQVSAFLSFALSLAFPPEFQGTWR